MGFTQILTIVGLLISIVAVFFAELAAYSGLLLVISVWSVALLVQWPI